LSILFWILFRLTSCRGNTCLKRSLAEMYALSIYLGSCQRGKHRAGHGTSPLTPLKYFIGHTFPQTCGEQPSHGHGTTATRPPSRLTTARYSFCNRSSNIVQNLNSAVLVSKPNCYYYLRWH